MKDASATAIYGSRGANGVILITTKKGVPGRSQISFESYFGVSRLANKLDVLSAQEFIDFRNDYQTWFPSNKGIIHLHIVGKVLNAHFRKHQYFRNIQPTDLKEKAWARVLATSSRLFCTAAKTHYKSQY